jgi:hypothetical protein
MDFGRIAKEGFFTGLLGAGAVAGWFFVVDVIAGQPLFTPAALGQAILFGGVSDPAAVDVAFPPVVGYTMLHVLIFVLVGGIAAAFACQIERSPATLFLAIVLFAVHEFGFYVALALFAQPLLGALAWTNVAVGNAIAAFGMGFYLWRAHPRLRQSLTEHPLGAVAD